MRFINGDTTMTTQTELRTFTDRKGATKAAKRDASKLPTTILIADIEYPQIDDRFGVRVILDHAPSEVNAADLLPVEGFEVVFAQKDAPAPKAPTATAKSRKAGEVNVEPTAPLLQCRAGSKQQQIVDLLVKGATMDDLRSVCVRKDGTIWDDNSIRSALYYDIKQKGYGVRTEFVDGEAVYHVVLPAGYEAALAPKAPKS